MTRSSSAAFALVGLLGHFVLFVGCASTTPSVSDASVPVPPPEAVEEAGAPEDTGAKDAASACSGDAGNACANCEQQYCCSERTACLADTACATARAALDACIASTDAGTSDRHSCFQTFEGKGKLALALHLCGEGNCRPASRCDIP